MTGRGRNRGGAMGLAIAILVGALLLGGPAAAAPPPTRDCKDPSAPKHFHRDLVRSIRISRDLPERWADSPFIARIVCWQGTDFREDFVEHGHAYHDWHGAFAMTTEEVETIAGPWMIGDRNGLHLEARCFVRGWERCSHTTANTRVVQQTIAGLRWIRLNFGTPKAAWINIRRTSRFNSYPREGTEDEPTRDPFERCPVVGPVYYNDDFGERRTVGGYHPHWGNDMGAPTGRPIRAPFDGLAVAHADDWFAGRNVTVVGVDGYVRNDHLSRFGHLGFVKAGAIIGYVGSTGDARGPHDHFEWHPWVVPSPRHRAPSGFSLIMDAIDPYPFLNAACHPARIAMPMRLTGE